MNSGMDSPQTVLSAKKLAEQLRLAYSQSKVAVIWALPISLFCTYLIRDYVPAYNRWLWIATICAVSISRWLHIAQYVKHREKKTNERWKKEYLASSAAAGIAWGSAAWLLYVPSNTYAQILLLLYMGGLLAAALSNYAVIVESFYLLCVTISLPLNFALAADHASEHTEIITASVVFTLALIVYARRLNLAISGSIEQRLVAEERWLETVRARSAAEDFQKSLSETQAIMHNTFEAVEEGVLTTDSKGNYVYSNKKALAFLGMTEAEMSSFSAISFYRRMGSIFGRKVHLLPFLRAVLGKGLGRLSATTKNGFSYDIYGERIDLPRGGLGYVWVCHDITSRLHYERALKDSEQQYRSLVERLSDGVCITQDGNLKFVNPALEKLLNFPWEKAANRPFIEFVSPKFREMMVTQHRKRLAGEPVPNEYEAELLHSDGYPIMVRINNSVISWNGGLASLATVTDISRNKQIELELRASRDQLYRLIMDAPFPLLLVEPNAGMVTIANARACGLLEFQASELPIALANIIDNSKLHSYLKSPRKYNSVLIEVALPKPGYKNQVRWFSISVTRTIYFGEQNDLLVLAEITEQKMRESQLSHMAHYDPLTGLPNRLLFQDRLKQKIRASKRNKASFAVMYLDLNDFKPINDVHGHAAGDYVLEVVGRRLHAAIRESDTAARLGGDEFAIILGETRERSDVDIVGQKIFKALREPIVVNGHLLTVRTGIGAAIYPVDGDDIETLIAAADAAMYVSKGKAEDIVAHASGDHL